MKKYDYLCFVGRFQPFHFGHVEVIERALSLSENVIVLVGSANSARTLRNPFTLDERYSLIKRVFPEVIVCGIDDHTYNDSEWVTQAYSTVKDIVLKADGWSPNGIKDYKIGLIGCDKDHSSYYLKLFPEWDSESVEFVDPINATDLRQKIFENRLEDLTELPDQVLHWVVNDYHDSFHFDDMKYNYDYVAKYKTDWGQGPHLTADALVQVGAHVLLINRGKEYGHGLLAMPGGFVNKGEKLKDTAIRELREETRIKVPEPVLRGSIVGEFLADDPHRSERGRIVSMVQHIKLENELTLPKVIGSDDAERAEWYNLADLKPQMFFEDHAHIIKKLTGVKL